MCCSGLNSSIRSPETESWKKGRELHRFRMVPAQKDQWRSPAICSDLSRGWVRVFYLHIPNGTGDKYHRIKSNWKIFYHINKWLFFYLSVKLWMIMMTLWFIFMNIWIKKEVSNKDPWHRMTSTFHASMSQHGYFNALWNSFYRWNLLFISVAQWV